MIKHKPVLILMCALLALFCFWCGEMALNTLYLRDQGFRGVTPALSLCLVIFGLWKGLLRQNRVWADMLGIFLLALCLRALLGWVYACVPVSDFLTEYQTAAALSAGDSTLVLSEKYTHRFPYILPFVFYQTLLIRIFSGSLLVLQWINALITASVCVVIYDIGRVFHRDCGILAGLCYAVYPSSIVMTQVLTNQHIATLLFYMVFWILLRKLPLLPQGSDLKAKGSGRIFLAPWLCWTLLSGLLFGLAHSMRSVGLPLLLAILLYWLCSLPWKRALFQGVIFIIGFMLISNSFYVFAWQRGILDDPGRRADFRYKLLTGFNHDSSGLYNVADAEGFFGTAEGEARSQYFLEAMKDRLSGPSRVLYLLGGKIYRMWGVTDASFYWMTIGEIDELRQALTENPDQPEIRRRLDTLYASTNLYATLDTGFYSLLMFFACAGALSAAEKFNESKTRPPVPAVSGEKHGFPDSMAAQPALAANALLAWALLGYASAHLFIEIQPRYRYFAMPAICMLAALGFLRIWHRIWRRAA